MKLKVQSIPGVPIPPRGGHLLGIILGCVFLGWKLSGRRSIPLPVPIFCSLSYASCASPTWLKIGRNYFYTSFLRRYLHGRQSCLRSSGPLENLLLQQNGENTLYNYNHICEVLQIKPMTERYDDRSLQSIPLKTM